MVGRDVRAQALRPTVSVDQHMIEHVFDTDDSAPLTRITAAARAEARAAAERLAAIGDLFRLRLSQHGNREDWVADTCDASG